MKIIDQWNWDIPLRHQVKEAKRTGNKELFWEAHLVGQRKEYYHMEQLTNLKALPPFGFKVCVFSPETCGGSCYTSQGSGDARGMIRVLENKTSQE